MSSGIGLLKEQLEQSEHNLCQIMCEASVAMVM